MVTAAYLRRRARAQARRKELPYGKYTTASGREVLFNRRYDGIAERTPDGKVSLLDPRVWVDDVIKQEWLYNDGTPEYEKRRRAVAALAAWGLHEQAIPNHGPVPKRFVFMPATEVQP
jgi:hypothetical protein